MYYVPDDSVLLNRNLLHEATQHTKRAVIDLYYPSMYLRHNRMSHIKEMRMLNFI